MPQATFRQHLLQDGRKHTLTGMARANSHLFDFKVAIKMLPEIVGGCRRLQAAGKAEAQAWESRPVSAGPSWQQVERLDDCLTQFKQYSPEDNYCDFLIVFATSQFVACASCLCHNIPIDHGVVPTSTSVLYRRRYQCSLGPCCCWSP